MQWEAQCNRDQVYKFYEISLELLVEDFSFGGCIINSPCTKRFQGYRRSDVFSAEEVPTAKLFAMKLVDKIGLRACLVV
jgi:hypothetical protein